MVGAAAWFRLAAAGLIIDPTWAVGRARTRRGATDLREQRGYFIAAGLTLGIGWSTAIAVGALIGARLDAVDLQIAIPLCLLGLVGAGLRRAGARSVIVVAAVVGLAHDELAVAVPACSRRSSPGA